eukprot:gnl/TRDRNA2_/TRDRNA2_84985_c0_seq2.p1 gnl/TRDRNA2_/TRDRNA2_84985_c0~~gnl/TRDRNA2_/TRDRNA2_84985_c0_seq2.p1  ORF type:complete len:251 (+),score=42.21 gnl/TRDRNA2_/TRDRNA2_84985_c0_seq2:118-870(+)
MPEASPDRRPSQKVTQGSSPLKLLSRLQSKSGEAAKRNDSCPPRFFANPFAKAPSSPAALQEASSPTSSLSEAVEKKKGSPRARSADATPESRNAALNVPKLRLERILQLREMYGDVDRKYDYKVDSPSHSEDSSMPDVQGCSEHFNDRKLDQVLNLLLTRRAPSVTSAHTGSTTTTSASSQGRMNLLSAWQAMWNKRSMLGASGTVAVLTPQSTWTTRTRRTMALASSSESEVQSIPVDDDNSSMYSSL